MARSLKSATGSGRVRILTPTVAALPAAVSDPMGSRRDSVHTQGCLRVERPGQEQDSDTHQWWGVACALTLCCRIALGVSLFTTLVLALTVCLGVLQIKLNIFKVRFQYLPVPYATCPIYQCYMSHLRYALHTVPVIVSTMPDSLNCVSSRRWPSCPSVVDTGPHQLRRAGRHAQPRLHANPVAALRLAGGQGAGGRRGASASPPQRRPRHRGQRQGTRQICTQPHSSHRL